MELYWKDITAIYIWRRCGQSPRDVIEKSKNACRLYWINDPWPGKLALAARPRGGDWLPDEVADWKRAGSESGFVGRKKCPCALLSGSGAHRVGLPHVCW